MRQLVGDAPWPSRLHVAFQEDTKLSHTGLHEQICRWAKSVDRPRLVVVDTLAAARPLGLDKRSIYQVEYEIVRGLNDLSHELAVAIVIVTHMRKAPGDDLTDTISGTNGVSAGADTLMDIRNTPWLHVARSRS